MNIESLKIQVMHLGNDKAGLQQFYNTSVLPIKINDAQVKPFVQLIRSLLTQDLNIANSLCNIGLQDISKHRELLILQATIQDRLGNWSQSTKLWETLVREHPQVIVAQEQLGQALFKNEQIEAAKTRLLQNISKWPERIQSWLYLGYLNKAHGTKKSNFTHWKDFTIKFPSNLPGQIQLGYAALSVKELSIAQTAFYAALSIKPSAISALTGLGKTVKEIELSKHPLGWSGERFLPEVSGEIKLEHMHRYLYASLFVKDKKILDIACGEGYGSHMLSTNAANVTGVDIDNKVIAYAQNKYKSPKIRFKQGSVTAMPIEDNSMDVIVCFETIEHVTQQDLVIRECRRVLKEDGLLIMSTPNVHFFTNKSSIQENQFHEKELSKEEIIDLCRPYFSSSYLVSQNIQYGSFIQPEFAEEVTFSNFEEGQVGTSSQLKENKFFLILASNKDLSTQVKNVSQLTTGLTKSQQYDELSKGINRFNFLKNQDPKINRKTLLSKIDEHSKKKELTECFICGGNNFNGPIGDLNYLFDEWDLNNEERKYIHLQQSFRCTTCSSNYRTQVVAKAIIERYGIDAHFKNVTFCESLLQKSILEVSQAHTLHPILNKMPHHTLGEYPDCDMQDMDYKDHSYDLVIHTDTLEHIPDPLKALKECYRILRPGGRLFFTIPIVVGRMSYDRQGIGPSDHGGPNTTREDYRVHTEFGSDFWNWVMMAGFSNCTIHTLDYPIAIAIEAQK